MNVNPKLVKVKWRDAFEGPSGWVSYRDYAPEQVFPVTVGWVFDDNKLEGYVTLYSTFYEFGDDIIVADPNHIPVEMVIEITDFSL